MQFEDKRFRYFKTADGSPTVFYTNSQGIEEAMHSYSGALAETQYIYGQASEKSIEEAQKDLVVLSLGLGLGYNEIMLAALSEKVGRPDLRFKIYSFESQAVLRDSFVDWLSRFEPGQHRSMNSWEQIYHEVLSLTSSHYGVCTDKVLAKLRGWFDSGCWSLLGDFCKEFSCVEWPLNLILYDAYSKKASPEIWQEAQLEECLSRSAESCVFATYSSNGPLKRSLRAAGFELMDKKGFAGKRESTLAIRCKPRHSE